MRFLVKRTPDNFIKSVNDEISSILNRHFDSYYPEFGYDEDMDKLSMPVEVTDKEKEYDIRAELPGVKKEDLDIDVEKNTITIRAKKEEENEEGSKGYKKSEFKYGEFSRSVYLPQDINIEKLKLNWNMVFWKFKHQRCMKQKSQLKNWLLNNFDTSNNGVVGGEVYFSANFGINDKFTFLILNNVTNLAEYDWIMTITQTDIKKTP